MERDFSLAVYQQLLASILARGYTIMTFAQYCQLEHPVQKKSLILRHDVDRRPANALAMAQLENQLRVQSCYYFRVTASVFKPFFIEKIAQLNHEIGYHYEDLSRLNGDAEKARESFGQNLERLRRFYPVITISMHGQPLSRWDNRLLWSHSSYRALGIIGEPYFDFDYQTGGYLTDTGRRWDGWNVNVRDKLPGGLRLKCHSTFELMQKFEQECLPQLLMINVHPERWQDQLAPWLKQLIWQKIKNVGKKILIKSS